MPKNLLIFSDGTGQAGGLIPDEARSNVYKLFRATRCGPDLSIDPSNQLAFYDAGLGSKSDGVRIKIGWWRWIYNTASQATGLGLTRNIIDCYAAILRMYEPGDRIFLFGFSRGAYTVRCVGGVLKRCGVPTQEKDGMPLRRDEKSTLAIAKEAVRNVYQHGSGQKAKRFEKQRDELSTSFRQVYGSEISGEANVAPYFIGVWDTVAAIGASWPRMLGIGLIFGAILWTGMGLLRFVLSYWIQMPPYWEWIAVTVGLSLVAIWLIYTIAMVKWAHGLSDPWWKTLHITQWRMRFYDTGLNPKVSFAKHALSIDENRRDFDKVAWTDHGNRSNDDAWFEQVWFAGNHSDIGGSYPENESRLSDAALKWMIEKATSVPHPMIIDYRFLNLYPNSDGPQHDERNLGAIPWKEGLRTIPHDAPLHQSAIDRFELERVLIQGVPRVYRPEPLRNHDLVKHKYSSSNSD